MLTLIRTYVDMIFLRKGPDAIPASWLVLSLSLLLLVVSSWSAVVLIDGVRSQNGIMTYAGYALGIAFYGAVIYVAGFPRRLLQTLSAIIACGAIITFLFVAEFMLMRPLLGQDIAGLLATLIIFWSVPVEGHLISRAIQQHWFVGITIAMAAFILQLGFQSAFAADV